MGQFSPDPHTKAILCKEINQKPNRTQAQRERRDVKDRPPKGWRTAQCCPSANHGRPRQAADCIDKFTHCNRQYHLRYVVCKRYNRPILRVSAMTFRHNP